MTARAVQPSHPSLKDLESRPELKLEKLEEDLEIDSLGIVEVVMAFEDEFEIEIDDEELTDVGTVGQAVNLLHSKL